MSINNEILNYLNANMQQCIMLKYSTQDICKHYEVIGNKEKLELLLKQIEFYNNKINKYRVKIEELKEC